MDGLPWPEKDIMEVWHEDETEDPSAYCDSRVNTTIVLLDGRNLAWKKHKINKEISSHIYYNYCGGQIMELGANANQLWFFVSAGQDLDWCRTFGMELRSVLIKLLWVSEYYIYRAWVRVLEWVTRCPSDHDIVRTDVTWWFLGARFCKSPQRLYSNCSIFQASNVPL